MIIISGVSLSEVPTMVGQAIKTAIVKTTFSTTCSETDSGDDLTVKGITSLKKNARVQSSETDSCVDGENQIEYYCENNAIKEEQNPCVCEDGVCVAYYKAEESPSVEVTAQEIAITKKYESKSTAQTIKIDTPQIVPQEEETCTDTDNKQRKNSSY